MNQTSDLDRLLGDWLTEGPNRAPDQPITAASRFAQAHPRRPDPLRVFRSDPMADRRRSPFGLQPALVFALLALVVAIVAAGVIGSRLENPSVVVPPSNQPSPSTKPGESPLASPSTTPTASQPPVPLFRSDLETTGGQAATVDVVDLSGLVVAGRSGPALQGGTVEGIVVTNDKADTLLITWAGSPCDTVHRLTVDATATQIVLERPGCGGDSIARDLSLILQFSRSIVASDVHASIVSGAGAGGALPNSTVLGPDTAGNSFGVSIYDNSGLLAGGESTSQGGGGATLPADKGRIDQVAPDTIKLTWARSACDADEQLTIDANARVLTLIGSGCGAGPATRAYDREMTLTFSSPVSAADMRLDVEVVR